MFDAPFPGRLSEDRKANHTLSCLVVVDIATRLTRTFKLKLSCMVQSNRVVQRCNILCQIVARLKLIKN